MTELTLEQTERLPEFVQKWISYGLSTEPADRSKAEEGARRSYQAAGLLEPKLFIWFDSPLLGGLASLALIQLAESRVPDSQHFGANVASRMWELRPGLTATVGQDAYFTVTQALAEAVLDSAWSSAELIISEGIEDDIAAAIEVRHWNKVRESFGDSISAVVFARLQAGTTVDRSFADLSVREGLRGQGFADWLSVFDYFSSVCGVACEQMDGWIQIGQSCGWWWPFEKVCLMTERRCKLHLDNYGDLHNESGLAVAYPDGWGQYAWHGSRVPASVIVSPEKITPALILEERSPKIRAAMLSRYGEDRFVSEAGIKVLPLRQYKDWLANNSSSTPAETMVLLRAGESRRQSIYLVRWPHVASLDRKG